MRRFIRILLLSIAIVVLLLISGIGIYYLTYRSVVTKTPSLIPQNIAVNFPLSANVNPFIGTGGIPWTCAYNFPGASVPFGLVRLSPETSAIFTGEKALNSSGYFYGDNKIIGFSHTRLVGTGATDGGHILVLPAEGMELFQKEEWHYRYNHSDELAYPGFYSVQFLLNCRGI